MTGRATTDTLTNMFGATYSGWDGRSGLTGGFGYNTTTAITTGYQFYAVQGGGASITALMKLSAADYVTMMGYNNGSTANLNTVGFCSFWGQRMG